jgi:Holliday junction resolvase RusA-like endonuclease
MTPLKLPMMMYGRFRHVRVKHDKEGHTVYLKNTAGEIRLTPKGKKIPVKEKVWINHVRGKSNGIYPSVNHIYKRIAHGRQQLNQPALDLLETWKALAYEWAQETHWDHSYNGKVVVELTAYFPNDLKKRDTNNVFKLLMDALEGPIYPNDVNALPRVLDFHTVEEEEPYFILNIYRKEDEAIVMRERHRSLYSPLSKV